MRKKAITLFQTIGDIGLDFNRYRAEGVSAMATLFFTQGFKATCRYRLCHFLLEIDAPHFLRPLITLSWRLIKMRTEVAFGISIPPQCSIGCPLYIPHFGPIVLNSRVKIGNNCTIHQGVTIGSKGRGRDEECPVLGDDVIIGANATLLGPIFIGSGTVVGAGAVVTRSTEKNAVVAGNPARPLRALDLKACEADAEDS